MQEKLQNKYKVILHSILIYTNYTDLKQKTNINNV